MHDEAPPSAGEVRALATQLLAWANHLSAEHVAAAPLSELDRNQHVLNLALELREGRRLRMRVFPRVQLGNPNWEVFLDLFIHELEGFRVTLKHLALTGDHPAPTVYDSIEVLERLGLVERTQDLFDANITWLSLTVTGRQGMYELFEQSADYVRAIAKREPQPKPEERKAS